MGIRRIDPFGRKVRDAEPHLRALEAWAESFATDLPDAWDYGGVYVWRLPILQTVVEAPASRDVERRCAQALVDAAAHLVRRRTPGRRRKSRAFAKFMRVDMFYSRVCLADSARALDEYVARLKMNAYRWKRLKAERSIVREIDLRCPGDFSEFGFSASYNQSDEVGGLELHDDELWIVGELTSSLRRRTARRRRELAEPARLRPK